MIEESQAWMREFFSSHTELNLKEKSKRVEAIRAIAEHSREDAETRSYVEWLVQQVEIELPTEARVFRAYYWDGQTARSTGRSLHMDKRSVYRCNRRMLGAMLPLVFGLGGIFESIQEAALDGPETAQSSKKDNLSPKD